METTTPTQTVAEIYADMQTQKALQHQAEAHPMSQYQPIIDSVIKLLVDKVVERLEPKLESYIRTTVNQEVGDSDMFEDAIESYMERRFDISDYEHDIDTMITDRIDQDYIKDAVRDMEFTVSVD